MLNKRILVELPGPRILDLDLIRGDAAVPDGLQDRLTSSQRDS